MPLTKLIRTPKDMDALLDLIEDMRGTQADLARVALMAFELGLRRGNPLAREAVEKEGKKYE